MGITRQHLYEELGLIQVVERATAAAMKVVEERTWHGDLDSSPHGAPWHTSFHVSAFPGDNPKACGRAALYSLLKIPKKEPIPRSGRGVMEVGKAIEEMLVETWHKAGILLTEPPSAPIQTQLRFPELWLTGGVDAVIRPEGWSRGHVCEVKSKDQEVIMAMKRGERSFDPQHRLQLMPYIWLAGRAASFLWPDIDGVDSGSIYYVSRQQPHMTHEFFFRLDEQCIRLGQKKLAEWREFYLAGKLPPRDKDWGWSDTPCKFCDWKRDTCKPDDKAKVEDLSESHGIEFAKSVYSDGYDYEETRKRVLKRWENK